MSDFSQRLSQLMDDGGFTQQAVADALNVSQRAVSGWLAGAKPRTAKLRKLADFFNVPLEVLEGHVPLTSTPQPSRQHDSREVYNELQALPHGDVAGFAALIDSMPEGKFKERMMDSVFKGVTDAVYAVCEEEIALSTEIVKALSRNDDTSALSERLRDYAKRQKNTAMLALELNEAHGLDLPVPRDVGSIKAEVLEIFERADLRKTGLDGLGGMGD
ncbi:MAG: XRE family transcriptional regulator [Puniceicoccaceae bacterium]|nr:MAG: XRE family transcriptional regulator [Puniceicoccaceae bacterium]